MLSRFGQECLLRGYTLNSFESVEDEDSKTVLILKEENYLDPDEEDEPRLAALGTFGWRGKDLDAIYSGE